MVGDAHHLLAQHLPSRGEDQPDVVDIEVDIRTIPGDNEDEVRRHIDKALGDLSEEVAVEKLYSKQASASPTARPSGMCSRRWWTGTTPGRSSCRA